MAEPQPSVRLSMAKPPPVHPLPGALARALRDLAVIALVPTTACLLYVLCMYALQRAAWLDTRTGGYALELIFGIGLVLGWWLCQRWLPLPESHRVAPRIGRVRAGCWGVLAGVGMLLFDQLLMHALASAGIEIEAANEDVIRQTLRHAPVFGLVQIALVAPLVEELIFRQRLFGRFWRAGHPGWGVVVTSLLFATLHEFGVDAGQPWHAWLILMGLYAASGGFFAWLYWRSGRLQTPIVAHAVNNLVLCVGMLWETAA